MITKAQRKNALRIAALDDHFGQFQYNANQTVRSLLNLSIPCAQLICAGVVTGVIDSFDAVNDQAVRDVERYCRVAVDRYTTQVGTGWWTEAAEKLDLPTDLENRGAAA